MYWKRATSSGVVSSMIVGIVSTALWAFNILPATTTLGLFYGLLSLVLAIITLVVVSLLTKPETPDRIENFFSAFKGVYED